jgi:hypothetical protein
MAKSTVLSVLIGCLILVGCGEEATDSVGGATEATQSNAPASGKPDRSEDCPAFDVRTSEGGITAELPCGANVKPAGAFSDRFVEHDGERCLSFDYTLSGVEETRVFCPRGRPEGLLTETREQ